MNAKVKPRTNRLAELRQLSKLTQKEVAKLLDISFTTVSKHENSSRGLSTIEINKYAQLYKVSSYEIFFEQAAPEEMIEDDSSIYTGAEMPGPQVQD